MKKTIYTWKGGGYLYDDGEVPECTYCKKNGTETGIFASAHSGVLVCDDKGCLLAYAEENILTDELVSGSRTVSVCDGCDAEEDADLLTEEDGDEFCDYCLEELQGSE